MDLPPDMPSLSRLRTEIATRLVRASVPEQIILKEQLIQVQKAIEAMIKAAALIPAASPAVAEPAAASVVSADSRGASHAEGREDVRQLRVTKQAR